MKFRVNDQVMVTAGKDKGKKSVITRVLPTKSEVVVRGANVYARHRRKTSGKAGEIVRLERPLATAKIAIINEQGQVDRIGYRIVDGVKQRYFKKTGTQIVEAKK
jgi:large subunit ribosomal protein L24